MADASEEDRRKWTVRTESAENFPDETEGGHSCGGSDGD